MSAKDVLEKAIATHGAGQPAAAEPLYRKALALKPNDPTALHCLGLLLHQTGRSTEAAPLLTRAAARDPRNAQTQELLAIVLDRLGRTEEAVAAWRRALALAPGNPEALNDLGNALLDLGRVDEAVAGLTEAIRQRPDFARAHNTLGVAHFEARRLDEAVACFRQAIRLDPTSAEAHNNLGAVLDEQGEPHAAIDSLRRAIASKPDYPDAHFHLGVALLRQGDYAEGWTEYEWRRLKSGFPRRDAATPEWRGGATEGLTLLAYAEQGLGDALQFLRYAPLLAAGGAHVVVEVPPTLVRLAATLDGVAGVVAAGSPPQPGIDAQVPLMSLPHLLGTRLDTVPAAVPYLHAEPAAAEDWGRRLAGLPGRKVGLAWSGAPRPHDRQSSLVDRRRSLPLSAFAPLAGIPGLTLVSLQKGEAAGQAAGGPMGLALFDAMGDIGDFADTAALVANLDLVISVDTSVAHLAGALGRPVWLLSRFDGCWRWLRERSDSPWYPTLRLFRQDRPGDWEPVIARLAAQLAGWAAR